MSDKVFAFIQIGATLGAVAGVAGAVAAGATRKITDYLSIQLVNFFFCERKFFQWSQPEDAVCEASHRWN